MYIHIFMYNAYDKDFQPTFIIFPQFLTPLFILTPSCLFGTWEYYYFSSIYIHICNRFPSYSYLKGWTYPRKHVQLLVNLRVFLYYTQLHGKFGAFFKREIFKNKISASVHKISFSKYRTEIFHYSTKKKWSKFNFIMQTFFV